MVTSFLKFCNINATLNGDLIFYKNVSCNCVQTHNYYFTFVRRLFCSAPTLCSNEVLQWNIVTMAILVRNFSWNDITKLHSTELF